jgi:hypothetical protein
VRRGEEGVYLLFLAMALLLMRAETRVAATLGTAALRPGVLVAATLGASLTVAEVRI